MTGGKCLLPEGTRARLKNRMAVDKCALARPPNHRNGSQNAPRLARRRAPERSLGERAPTSAAEAKNIEKNCASDA